MEQKQKIINHARVEFVQKGFKNLSMDDISTALGISKKTLYKHFPSKEGLFEECVMSFFKQFGESLKGIILSDQPVIAKFLSFFVKASELSSTFNAGFWDDMRTNQPKIWTKVDEFRVDLIQKNFKFIVIQGQEEGVFRKYDAGIIVTTFLAIVREFINPHFLLQYNLTMKQAIVLCYSLLINATFTEKGKKEILKLRTELSNEILKDSLISAICDNIDEL
ncbi:MAG: TetR/AcrR family transcriptional regulator [Ignavibacteriaceae bacterium]|nr:TetR/AcrR family transcriptional regulator [Ignavibacteriaceae bacterium]